MLGLKLNNVSKRDPRDVFYKDPADSIVSSILNRKRKKFPEVSSATGKYTYPVNTLNQF